MQYVKLYFILCRALIALFAACFAATGFLIAAATPSLNAVVIAAAVFLLACGTSAMNQYQERRIDALMERTKHRPLPTGVLKPRHALTTAAILIAAGILLISRFGAGSALIGAAAVIWYNGVYTPLKRRTALAAIYGAPVGILPLMIGWTAAGGELKDIRLAALALFSFLWQTPHFWLLLLKNTEDYRRAGLPALTDIIPQNRLAIISIIWVAAAAATTVVFPLFGMMDRIVLYIPLFLIGAAVITIVAFTITGERKKTAAFVAVNFFLIALMLLLSIDAVAPMR